MKSTLPFLLLFLLSGIFSGCSTFQEDHSFDNPAAQNSRYPYLYSTGSELYMSWITLKDDNNTSLNYARYTNGSWSRPQTIAADSTWFVNWADFPSVIADREGPVAAHWLDKKPGGAYAYDVNISIAQSPRQWSPPVTPHFDSTATEHGFASMIPWDEDTFLAVWLDGRQTANRADDDYYNLKYAMTLRGAFIDKNGEISEKFLIDDSVCDCCQTSLIKTGDGAVVAYRNRTDEEIRDIYVSRFDGEQWSDPTAVHNDGWKIGACPVNGPKLAASDNSVAVAWHTAAEKNPSAKVALSSDRGETFGAPITVSTSESIGRVDATVHNGKTYVSWMEKSDKGTYLKIRSVGNSGSPSKPATITAISESRKSGFPQMERLGNRLYFAWTRVDSAGTQLQTKSMPLPLE